MNFTEIVARPPYDYNNIGINFTIDQFFDYAKAWPNTFIHYCEILITPLGMIQFCIPSHEQTLVRMLGYESTDDLVDEYTNQGRQQELIELNLLKATGCVSVYYDIQKYYQMTETQKYTLKFLNERGYIRFNLIRER